MTAAKKYRPGRGYTRKDRAAVDNPELTDKQIVKGQSFQAVFPELHASIKRARGRPKIENPKAAITLRVSPDTIEKFKATGKDWRTRMAKVLERAKG